MEPVITPLNDAYTYPLLTLRPEADCKRYETLCSAEEGPAVLDAAFCMMMLNGRMISMPTSALYREAVETLLRNAPKVGTPYLITYTGLSLPRCLARR